MYGIIRTLLIPAVVINQKVKAVEQKPTGLDLLIHVIIICPHLIIYYSNNRMWLCLKSQAKVCVDLVLNECYCHTIYDTRMKSSVYVTGNVKYLIDIVTFVIFYHLQP